MRVVVLFLCLCFLLPKGNSFIHAATQQHGDKHTAAQQAGQNSQVSLANTPKDCAVFTQPQLETELKYIISDEAEDEDSNDFPTPAFRLPAKNHLTGAYPSFVSILKHPSNCFKAAPPRVGPAPDLCLLQGVFRI